MRIICGKWYLIQRDLRAKDEQEPWRLVKSGVTWRNKTAGTVIAKAV